MRVRRATFALVLVAVIASSCSDDVPDAASASDSVGVSSTASTPSSTTGPSSTIGLTTTTSRVGSPDVSDAPNPSSTPPPPAEVLEPADTALPPNGSISVNEAGEPVTLDETASLACALVDVATESVRISDIDGAVIALAQAAQRAEPSSIEDIADQADAMHNANGKTAGGIARRVRALCVSHGHQV